MHQFTPFQLAHTDDPFRDFHCSVLQLEWHCISSLCREINVRKQPLKAPWITGDDEGAFIQLLVMHDTWESVTSRALRLSREGGSRCGEEPVVVGCCICCSVTKKYTVRRKCRTGYVSRCVTRNYVIAADMYIWVITFCSSLFQWFSGRGTRGRGGRRGRGVESGHPRDPRGTLVRGGPALPCLPPVRHPQARVAAREAHNGRRQGTWHYYMQQRKQLCCFRLI